MIENIPQELTQLRQWVCWRKVKRGDKWTKPPCKINGEPASVTNPANWSRIADCQAAVNNKNIEGIGFVFTDDDPFSGIDLDHCFEKKDGKKVLKPWARKIVADMDSYTEFSPSDDGLHIITRARIGGVRGHRKDGIELYDIGRYFTFTGNVFEGNETINDPQEEVSALWRQLGSNDVSQSDFTNIKIDLNADPPFELFNALRENSKKFNQTWKHQRADLKDQSLSTYDMSLVALAARAGWNDDQLAALLAAHRREWGDVKKLERSDYIGRTIAMARSGLSDGLDEKELVADAGLASAMAEGGDTALTELGAILGTSVDGFIRRGMEPTLVYAITNAREFLWEEQDNLISYPVAKKTWFGQTGQVIKTMKAPTWERIIKRIIDLATYQPDSSTSRIGAIVEELLLYTSDRMEGRKNGLPDADVEREKEDAEEMLRMRMPFTRGENLLFNIFDFMEWRFMVGMSRNKDRQDLHRLLTEAGYIKKPWAKIREARSRSYYTGPKINEDDE